jgi:hypothetical protein
VTGVSNLAALDQDADTVVISRGPVGRIYCFNGQHPDFDLAFAGTHAGTSLPGEVCSFNYITGEVTHLFYFPDIGGVKQGISNSCGGLYSDEANKRVFFGGGLGGLYAWDPTVAPGSAFQDYGLLDANVGNIKTLQATATHAYVAGGGNFLAICNLSTGGVTKVWEGDGCTLVEVYRSYYTSTTVYIKKVLAGVTTWWEMATDPLVPTYVGTSDPGVHGANTRGPTSVTGYSQSTAALYPGPDKAITFMYKRPGDTDYRLLDSYLLDVADYSIQRMFVDAEHNIICCPQFYGALSKYTPATDTKSRIGNISSLSPYGFGVDRHRNLQWFSGYPAETWQHDTTDPTWDLTTNPVKLTGMPYYSSKGRAQFIVRANDGLIWFGTSLENSPEGCQIFWYDPDGLTYGEIDRSVMAGHDPGYYHYPKFCMNLAATKLVMSAYHSDGSTKGLVAVVYMPTKAVRYLYPLGDVVDQGVLVSVERSQAATNHFVGITNSVSSLYTTFCINIQTGAFIWGPITGISGVTSFPYLSGGQPIFRHGYVWFYVGNTIVKLDPDDGSLVGTPYNLVTNGTVAGNMLWSDDGEYLYHFGINQPNLFQIPKADLGV